MKTVDDFREIYNALLDERYKVIQWVIQGTGIHGFTLKDVKHLKWDWIVENYSVCDYQCKHKIVDEIGMVQTFEGCEYDGFCNSCDEMVYGTIKWNGEKERWH
jgi:hypothetical protein